MSKEEEIVGINKRKSLYEILRMNENPLSEAFIPKDALSVSEKQVCSDWLNVCND